MLYKSASDWLNAKEKKVLLFGMSGLGKTYISNMLRESGDWYQYSVDYRIGTRYMGEHIVDNFKREAMKNPFLRELLMSDSMRIRSNITFNNLAPLSTYLGKPGDVAKGGLAFDDYLKRQEEHCEAETAAMYDTHVFIGRAQSIYGYPNFVCDSSGSFCEVVDPEDKNDPVLSALSNDLLLVWLKGDAAHSEELARRFDRAPKPMYYQPAFLAEKWSEYLSLRGVTPECVDPDDFIRWTYAQALDHRQPRYKAIADNWGITVPAEDMSKVSSPADFEQVIAAALEAN